MANLEACPFCKETSVSFMYDSYSDVFTFDCPNCKAHVWFGYTSASIMYGSKEKARIVAQEKWNKRRKPYEQ